MINLTKQKQEFKSVLFIGDPHLRSIDISNRNDPIHFSNTILNKLEQIANLTHEYQAYPVILGDLFDSSKEKSISLLSQSIAVFKKFYFTPSSIVGNHDKTETELTDSNMLGILFDTGILHQIENNKISVQLLVNGIQVEIGGTNYGSKIPSKVTKKSKNTEKVLWVTHDDLMFKDYYPGSKALHPIEGVCLAVNGHMHGTQPQVQLQNTSWCCPGNIARMSIDMIDHVPSVWLWTPEQHDSEFNKLKQIPLDYQKDIFRKDLVIDANNKIDFQITNHVDDRLKFIELIQKTEDNMDSNKTSDKEQVRIYMEHLIDIQGVSSEIAKELYAMIDSINENE